jgi:hypothetical protein
MWRSLVITKYDSLGGGKCSKEVARPYGVGMWKCTRRGWKGFSKFVRHEVRDRSKV